MRMKKTNIDLFKIFIYLVIYVFFFILVSSYSEAQHSVTLQGCSSTTPGVQYNFYRGTTPGGESTTPLNATPQVTCSWTDTTVLGLTTYYYTAKAYCSTCSPSLSLPSNEVRADIPANPQPAPPTGLTTGTITQNNVPLFWNAPIPESGYIPVAYFVYRGNSPTLLSPSRIAVVPGFSPTYVDHKCKVGTICYYYVKAYDIGPNNNSFVLTAQSNTVMAID